MHRANKFHWMTTWCKDNELASEDPVVWIKAEAEFNRLLLMSNEKKEIRDKVEDLYIKETERFAFLDENELDPRYVMWLEKKVYDLLVATKQTLKPRNYSCVECGEGYDNEWDWRFLDKCPICCEPKPASTITPVEFMSDGEIVKYFYMHIDLDTKWHEDADGTFFYETPDAEGIDYAAHGGSDIHLGMKPKVIEHINERNDY